MKGTGQAILIGGIVANSLPLTTPTLKVNAQENTKAVIKTIAKLRNDNLNDTKTLKSYVIDTFAKETNTTNVTSQNTKVIMKSPTVVTSPTIDNSEFIVIPTETTSQIETTITKLTDDPNDNNNIQTENNNSKITDENKSANTLIVQDDNQIKDTVSLSQDSDDTVLEEQATTSDSSNEIIDLDTTDVINEEPISNEQKNDLVEINKIENSTLNIKLTTDEVTINELTEFDPNEYIANISSSDNSLPALTIDNPVNLYEDGIYEVTYKIVDLSGNSETTVLTVNVETSENIENTKKEKTEQAVMAYANKLAGHSYDIDGYYGDQCWDLWAKYCSDFDLNFDYSTQPYGYAYGVSLKYKTSGASKYFTAVSADEIQCGDWLFWDKGSSCESSHVALLLKNNGDGTGVCLTQSYGNGTRIMTLKLDVMKVNFRPKGSIAWYNQK